MLLRLKLWAAPLFYALLAGTVRVAGGGTTRRDGSPVIFACLHRNMIPAILHVKHARPALLVSRSTDGDILIQTLGRHGYSFVRGSTGKEGGGALRGLLAALAGGSSVGIAVDGPRGPFGVVHDGVIKLSRLSGAPIVPLTVKPGKHKVLGTWDRTVLPLPFSSVDVTEWEEMRIPSDVANGEIGVYAQELAERLLAGEDA